MMTKWCVVISVMNELPFLVGPFDTEREVKDFARTINLPSGTINIAPYIKSRGWMGRKRAV